MKNSYSYLFKNPLLFFYLKTIDFFFCFFKKKQASDLEILPKKILLVHLAHLGDVVIATSVIPLLKKKYPFASISVLVGKASQGLLEDHPLIDKIHVIDHPKLLRKKINLLKKIYSYFNDSFLLIKTLRKEAYDLSIDLYCYYPNSHLLTRLSNIPLRIGFTSGGGGPLLTHRVPWINSSDHMSLHLLRLLSPLYIKEEKKEFLKPSLNIPKKNLRSKPYWIIHPYSPNPLKNCEDIIWKELINYFKNSSFELIFTGAAQWEKERVDPIIENSPYAINLCAATSLSDLQTLIYHSEGVICVDTVTAHIASAYDKLCFVACSESSDHTLWLSPYLKRCFFKQSSSCLKKEKCVTINPITTCLSEHFHHENNHLSRRLWDKTF